MNYIDLISSRFKILDNPLPNLFYDLDGHFISALIETFYNLSEFSNFHNLQADINLFAFIR